MKAKKKMLLLLLALLALAGGGYALLAHANEQAAQSASAAESIVLSSFSADSLTSISYTYNGEEIDLQKQDDSWVLAGDTAYHVMQTYADSMATALCQMSASRVIENVTDYAQYGLDAPDLTVTAGVGGETMRFYFGGQNTISEIGYLQMEGDNNVYAVSSSLESAFQYDKAALYDTAWLPLSLKRSDIARIDYHYATADTDYTVSLTAQTEQAASQSNASSSQADSAAESTQVWYFAGTGEEVNPTMVSSMLDALYTAPTAQLTSPGALAAYGLSSPTLTVRAVDTNGAEQTLSVGIGTDGYYLMRTGDDSVYTVTQALTSAFAFSQAQLAKPAAASDDTLSAESALNPALDAAG